ncbi:MAG: heme exporter protein CcmD [Granulosicoccus sp.]|nr:heme exporter protein CcmD [Granulosicoccus sp.]
MDSVLSFFHMGGYAFYVWSAYALSAFCLVGIVLWSARQYRKAHQQAVRRSRQAVAQRTRS